MHKANSVSYRAALGGMVSALCLLLIFLAGLIPPLAMTLPLIAGMLLVLVVKEVSMSWAFLTYLSVSALSLLVCYDKEAPLIFIMLFGHYPLLKQLLERVKLKPVVLILKLAVFNVCILSFFAVIMYISGSDEAIEGLGEFGESAAKVMLIAGNFAFLMYDFVINIYAALLIRKLSKAKSS
jgi:hypothetical protein